MPVGGEGGEGKKDRQTGGLQSHADAFSARTRKKGNALICTACLRKEKELPVSPTVEKGGQ